MIHRSYFTHLGSFVAGSLVVLLLGRLDGCRRDGDVADVPAVNQQPSQQQGPQKTLDDGSTVQVWSQQQGEMGALVRSLKSYVADLEKKDKARTKEMQAVLSEVKRLGEKNVLGSTVVSTRTAKGDTVTTGITTRLGDRPKGLFGIPNPFKDRPTLLDIRQFTPGAETVGMSSVALPPQKPKRWGLSLYAGYGINSRFERQPSVGLAVTWDLLQR